MKIDSTSLLGIQAKIIKKIENKDQKSLAWSSAWLDWNSQSYEAIHNSAKYGRRKRPIN